MTTYSRSQLGNAGFPGGFGSSFLSTDGGGRNSAQSPDGGGRGNRALTGITMEALAKTFIAVSKGEKEDLQDEWIALASEESSPNQEGDTAKAPSPPPPPSSQPDIVKLLRADPGVRATVLRTRVMGRLGFKLGEVFLLAGNRPLFTTSSPGDTAGLLKHEIAYLRRKADARGDRLEEIFVQATDLFSFYESILKTREDALPRTYDLVDLILGLSHEVVMQVKFPLACPRPSEVSRQIMPMLEVPSHASFPSGHATAAYALSELMVLLLKLKQTNPLATRLRKLAFRIAQNREVAGLHFSVDSAAGQLLGTALARFVAALAEQFDTYRPKSNSYKFLAGSLDETSLRALRLLRGECKEAESLVGFSNASRTTIITGSYVNNILKDDLLKEIWTLAQKELKNYHQ